MSCINFVIAPHPRFNAPVNAPDPNSATDQSISRQLESHSPLLPALGGSFFPLDYVWNARTQFGFDIPADFQRFSGGGWPCNQNYLTQTVPTTTCELFMLESTRRSKISISPPCGGFFRRGSESFSANFRPLRPFLGPAKFENLELVCRMIMNEWYSSAMAGFVICGATDWLSKSSDPNSSTFPQTHNFGFDRSFSSLGSIFVSDPSSKQS
ncbi:hypothetical protein ACFX11_045950 [Malus domestica]